PRPSAVEGLKDVADTTPGNEPARVAIEDGVRVGWVGRIDGHAGDVPVRQSGRAYLVPVAAVVRGDPGGEAGPGVAAVGHPGGVDDAPASGGGQRRDGVVGPGVERL